MIRVMKKLAVMGITAVLALAPATTALAQEDALKDYPGYVDFGDLSDMFGEPSVQISVGESLLGLVGSLSASEDPEAAELFRRLNGVRVNVFETSEMVDGAVDMIREISGKLAERGWESVVTVNSQDEQVRIFMLINGDTVDGITVMAVEESEAVFVNVIGNINPAELGKVMDNFDVDYGNGNSDDE